MCQTVILSHKGATLISQCVECRVINIWHHNILLYFTPDELTAFKDFMYRLDVDQYTFPFPDGSDRLIVRTPNKDINLCFTGEEWANFQEALTEAGYMQAIYEMMQ